MNPRTFVATKIAPPAGADVPVTPITDAFPSGYFAMEKMIAETDQMSSMKIARLARKKETLDAEIEDAFLSMISHGYPIARIYLLWHQSAFQIPFL